MEPLRQYRTKEAFAGDAALRRLTTLEMRLAAITSAATDLKSELCDLNRLRDQIKDRTTVGPKIQRIGHEERRVLMRPTSSFGTNRTKLVRSDDA